MKIATYHNRDVGSFLHAGALALTLHELNRASQEPTSLCNQEFGWREIGRFGCLTRFLPASTRQWKFRCPFSRQALTLSLDAGCRWPKFYTKVVFPTRTTAS